VQGLPALSRAERERLIMDLDGFRDDTIAPSFSAYVDAVLRPSFDAHLGLHAPQSVGSEIGCAAPCLHAHHIAELRGFLTCAARLTHPFPPRHHLLRFHPHFSIASARSYGHVSRHGQRLQQLCFEPHPLG
jgi:hypothetical protein